MPSTIFDRNNGEERLPRPPKGLRPLTEDEYKALVRSTGLPLHCQYLREKGLLPVIHGAAVDGTGENTLGASQNVQRLHIATKDSGARPKKGSYLNAAPRRAGEVQL